MKKTLILGLFIFASQLNAYSFREILTTCSTLALDKASISAVCTAENGAKYKTSIRLRGISNRNGSLVVEDDSAIRSVFHKTCKNTGIDSKAVLAGTCKDDAGSYVWTSLDLKRILKNYNGTLVYPIE